MMSFAVHRLKERSRATLLAHLLALPMRDRSLRFGMALAPTVIAAYVGGIDFDRDAVFVVYDNQVVPIGIAHIAFEDDLAELAFSVLPTHRCLGVGSAMFKRAVPHARSRCVPRLYMHCLAENAPVMRIARKFGMHIVVSTGNADAYLKLQLDSLAWVAIEAEEPVAFSAVGSDPSHPQADPPMQPCESIALVLDPMRVAARGTQETKMTPR
jgi:GNAT superfamily N-acetyltransferase